MKLAIMASLQDELSPFFNEIKDLVLEKKPDLLHLKFYSGKLDGFNIILSQTGIGKVNATIASQILINLFFIDTIIHVGVAGAVSPYLKVGDIVIGNRFIQHDVDLTVFNISCGEIIFDTPPIKNRLLIDRQLCLKEFKADPDLVSLAENASKTISSLHHSWSDSHKNPKIKKGTIISGDQFISTQEKTRILYEDFKADAIDMESAAVAQVCYLNKIPYIGIRGISDNADHSAPKDFATNLNEATLNYYQIVKEMIKTMNSK